MTLEDLISHGAMITISAENLDRLVKDEIVRVQKENERKGLKRMSPELRRLLGTDIRDFEIRYNINSTLFSSGRVSSVGDLVRMRRNDVLKIRNIGTTKLRFIEESLEENGLGLEMNLDEYDYEND